MDNSGFVFTLAKQFNALVVFAEHVSDKKNVLSIFISSLCVHNLIHVQYFNFLCTCNTLNLSPFCMGADIDIISSYFATFGRCLPAADYQVQGHVGA